MKKKIYVAPKIGVYNVSAPQIMCASAASAESYNGESNGTEGWSNPTKGTESYSQSDLDW